MSGIKLSHGAAETLRSATAGNPFFIREVATFLPAQERLIEDDVYDVLPASLVVPAWRQR